MARRSFLATGGIGAVPMPLTIRRTSKPSVSILWRPVSRMRAAIWTPPARLAVGATTNVSWAGCSRAFWATHATTASSWQLPSLEHQHAVRGLLLVAELLEQLVLHPGVRPERARAHREELLDRDGPARVLRRHARDGGMVGPHGDPRPCLGADLDRRVAHVAQPAHADLRQGEPRIVAAIRLDAGVDHPRAAGQRVAHDPEQRRVFVQLVRDLGGELVHS